MNCFESQGWHQNPKLAESFESLNFSDTRDTFWRNGNY